jgi:predicted dehydrogenase
MGKILKKIRTAIVGAGGENIATSCHIPGTLAAENLELAALCDLNPKVAGYAEKFGVKAVSSLDGLLAAPDIDMVQIATPDWLHLPQTKAALAAGKHVLLQKPPCLNFKELAELRKASASSKARLKISLNQRETKLSRTIKKNLDDGVIGQVREIIIRFRGRRFPIQNLSSPYLKKACGGVWLHNGMHWLDEAFLYSGALPSSVQVFAAKNEEGPPSVLGEGPNYWSAVFTMGRVTFLFEYNTMLTADGMPGGMQRTVMGTEGEIRQDYGSPLTLYKKGATGEEAVTLVDPQIKDSDDMVNSFRLLLENFAAEITDGAPRPPFAGDSLTLMEALLAGAESAETGETVKIGDVR